MKLERFRNISEADSLEAFKESLVRFANELDFGIISGALVIEHTTDRTTNFHLGNTPEAFSATFSSTSVGQRDPVLKRLKRMNVPFIYDQDLYVNEQAADLWDTQAPFGYKTGIAVALHLPGHKHFLLGVDREAPLPRSETKVVRMLADLQLAAVHAQDAAVRLCRTAGDPTTKLPPLTPRETEVLKWSKDGKSASVVAQILGMKERTVAFHVHRILVKFECESKHHAIRKAMEEGLI